MNTSSLSVSDAVTEKFGFIDIYYYAEERFGFSPRKTRYLLHLGQKIRDLPLLRKALEEGRLGWTKASRIARVATSEDEAMWLDSALSLSVRELDRKIEGERDDAGVKVRAWLTQDQAAVFDHAVEVCRRVAGADLDIGRCPRVYGCRVDCDLRAPGAAGGRK